MVLSDVGQCVIQYLDSMSQMPPIVTDDCLLLLCATFPLCAASVSAIDCIIILVSVPGSFALQPRAALSAAQRLAFLPCPPYSQLGARRLSLGAKLLSALLPTAVVHTSLSNLSYISEETLLGMPFGWLLRLWQNHQHSLINCSSSVGSICTIIMATFTL